MAGHCKKEEKDQYRQILGDVIFKGYSIMEAIKFPPALIELIFSFANDLYSEGKYEDANKLYYLILQLNPKDDRFLSRMRLVSISSKSIRKRRHFT